MRKLVSYIPFLILFLIGTIAIVRLIMQDLESSKKLRGYKMLLKNDSVASKIVLNARVKSYFYITLDNGEKLMIGPAKEITSKEKIFGLLSSGDSIVKSAGSDTLLIVSEIGAAEKFFLLY